MQIPLPAQPPLEQQQSQPGDRRSVNPPRSRGSAPNDSPRSNSLTTTTRFATPPSVARAYREGNPSPLAIGSTKNQASGCPVSSFPHISSAISLNFPPPVSKAGSCGDHRVRDACRTGPHSANPRRRSECYSSPCLTPGQCPTSCPSFSTRTYDRDRERKSRGARLTSRCIEISHTEDF